MRAFVSVRAGPAPERINLSSCLLLAPDIIEAIIDGADPSSAVSQRDLVAKHSKLAVLHGQRGDQPESQRHRRVCLDVLRRMRQAGMHLDPPLVQMLERLEARLH